MAQNKPLEISVSSFCGMNAGDDLGAQNSVKIDKKLWIDANQLLIGPVISEGHYSIVHEGKYGSIPVAVKVIQPDMESIVRPDVQERFVREVSVLSKVQHDNIVKFIGAIEEPAVMIITEFMSGGTLQKFLWSIRPNCPDLKLSIKFALDISQAMEFLHQNQIIHRDLKPSNLLLTEDKMKIKIADFGLAQEERDDKIATEAGTYRWMAPELFNVKPLPLGAKRIYNHKVDVYSFSLVLWEMLTNTTPFKGRSNLMVAYAVSMNQRPSLDNIPAQIAPFLQSCWTENPDDRPDFVQITHFLKGFLHNICPSAVISPPILLEEEHSRTKDETEESAPASCLMERPAENKKKPKNLCLRFLGCSGHCL